MDQQHLCINAGTGEVTASNVSSSLPSLSGILGTLFVLRVTFEQDNVPVALPANTTGKLTVKLPGAESGSPVLLDTSWTLAGSGAQTSYTFSLLADSEPLRTALANSAAIALTAQIEWQITSELPHPRKSLAFPITLRNSPSRPGDTAPDPAADAAWAWIKARLVAGSNVTFTLNEETKTITINSAGGASNPTVTWSNVTSKPTSFPSTWNEVTGKPSTFPPSTHSHAWSQITSGTPSDNAALVAFVQSNGASGQMFDLLIPLQLTSQTSYNSLISVPDLILPRDAVITHIGLVMRDATPRMADNFFQLNVVIYGTDAPNSSPIGYLYAQSFWFYEYFPNSDAKGLGIPLLANGSVTMPAGSKLDVSLDTGFPDAYNTRPTINGLWLRVRGRYTN
jgi:hypothetical protein